MSQIPKMLTTKEAAEYLRSTPGTLERWRSTGYPQGPIFLKVGHQIRYRKSDLDAFLEACRRRTTADTGPALSPPAAKNRR